MQPGISAIPSTGMNLSPAQTYAVDRTARQFEAMVLAQFLAPLFESVETPGIAGGGGAGEKAFKGLLQEEYAKAIAARGGVGIADHVKGALIAMQARGGIINGEHQ